MVDRPGAQRRQQLRTPAIYFETEFVLLGELGLRLTMGMITILAYYPRLVLESDPILGAVASV